jgi:hypothetical protein
VQRTYQVTYEATYYVRADNEDEALDLAIEEHSEAPDGSWEAQLEPYKSPLEDLDDGTYFKGIDGLEDYEGPKDGYWVGTVAVQALSDVPLGAFLGVWTDPADGKRYYDITVYQIDLTEALRIGKQFSQISIWDISEKRPIPVNV